MKKYDLAGEWLLWLDENREGSFEEGGLSHEFDDAIVLPSTTAQAEKTLHGINQAREVSFLTEKYPFCGWAWYQRRVEIGAEELGRPMYLYLERTRMTRVWIDGTEIGGCKSICTPHRYEIGSAVRNAEFTITVCVDNTDYPTKGGHMTSPDTQTNWNGILGRLELQVFQSADVLSAGTEADAASGTLHVALETVNTGSTAVRRRIFLSGEYVGLAETWQEKEDCSAASEQMMPESENCCGPDAVPAILQAEPVRFAQGAEQQEILIEPGVQRQVIEVKVENPKRFSEFSPYLGRLHIACGETQEDAERVRPVTAVFGFREFTAGRHHFYINGTKTFLRGKHDGMIFPLTGAAPMSTKEWLRVMSISKSFGINHYRFHTCCPPEAAFCAADLLGIYMEPELPFWGTIADAGEEGYNGEEQEYLIREGFRLMEVYGSHPSFVMLSLGNELWGSRKRLGEIIEGFRAVDRRHLYTSGSNNFQFYPSDIPEEDFFAGVRFDRDSLIRGSYAMCDAPQGFVQTERPNTAHSYDVFFDSEQEEKNSAVNADAGEQQEIEIQYGTGVKRVKASQSKAFTTCKPVVSHEVGQYCTYPDFGEISHYTGVLEARSFEVFRERLEKAGMLPQADEFFRNSGALAAFCYKLELEAAHRSRLLAGYQLLDIQDFSGQGTALVGVLNALMEEKGIVSREAWRGFCGPTLALAELPRFVYRQGAELPARLIVSHYGEKPLKGVRLCVSLENAKAGAAPVWQQAFPRGTLRNGVHEAGSFSYVLPQCGAPQEYRLVLTLRTEDGTVWNENYYSVYSYPDLAVIPELSEEEVLEAGALYVTRSTAEARRLLQRGLRVLLMPGQLRESVPGTFCTDFWCYPMFRSISESVNRPVPVGTLGLSIDSEHPALAGFGSHAFSTPQWYSIVTESDSAVLDGTALKPIVQTIDNFERNHKLGLVFEARCMGGSLLVCTSRLWRLRGDEAAENLYRSLAAYGSSESFRPGQELTGPEFERIFGAEV
ncbi:MAG: beta-glucuronidase [Lachnospiraceae bacterium]|nr:beta-glucuronidase [Lachnospiraceae bacterium]